MKHFTSLRFGTTFVSVHQNPNYINLGAVLDNEFILGWSYEK